MNSKAWVLLAALTSAGAAQATCYSVYKANGTLVHESSTPPVDLSMQLGDTVPEKFGPGATMTISDHAVWCRDKREVQGTRKSLAETVRAEGEKAEQVAAARQAAAGKAKGAPAQ